MTTATLPTTAPKTRKPAPKPQRHARITGPVGAPVRVLTLTLTHQRQHGQLVETFGYFLSPLPSDFGDAFRLEKIDPNPGEDKTYNVALDNAGSICDCKGFLKHGHCKHVESLIALKAAGKL